MTIRRPLGTVETLAILALILAVGLGLRGWNLGGESLWLDEAHSVIQAQRGVAQIWIHEATKDPNPPLYFTVLKFWMRAFGTSEAAVRSLSVVCGMAAIIGIYLFGRTAGGVRLGLAAAALAATSPWLVIYSRDTRGYALATAAATLSAYGALKLFALFRLTDTAGTKGTPSRLTAAVAWGAYVGGAVVAMYTHATLVLLPVLANLVFATLWIMARRRDWRGLAMWLAGNAVVAVAWLPWVPNVMGGAVVAGTFWVPAVSIREALAIVREVDAFPYTRSPQPWLDLAILAIAVAGTVRLSRSIGALLLCLAVVVLVPFLTWLISLARPIFLERVLIWPLPFLCVLLAAGLLTAPRRWIAGVLILVLVMIEMVSLRNLVWSNHGWVRFHEPWRDVAARVRSERQPGDVVVIVPEFSAMPYEYYAGGDPDTRAVALKPITRPSPHWSYATIASDDLPAQLAGRTRIWLVVRRQPSDTGINGVVDRLLHGENFTRLFHDRDLELHLIERRP
jgi:mannosyltransferase